MFGNIAGLIPQSNKVKVKYLDEFAKEANSIIIALTESHLKSHILDAEIYLPGYQVVRKDRVDSINKGGVITYVKDSYSGGMKILVDGCNGTVEWTVISIPKVDTILINLYRPPSCPKQAFENAILKVSQSIDTLEGKFPTIIMCGDFNMPTVDWCNNKYTGGTKDSNIQIKILFEFMNKYSLSQMVKVPTRLNNTLDLLLTNNQELIMDIQSFDTTISDHRIMIAHTYFMDCADIHDETDNRTGFNELNFHESSIDWAQLNLDLSAINWEYEMRSNDIHVKLQVFYDILYQNCLKHIPKKVSRRKRHQIPRDRRILMRNRKNLMKSMSTVNNTNKRRKIQQKLELIEFKLLESHRMEEKKKEKKAVDVIKENPKYFFSYAKSKSKIRTPVGPLECEDKLEDDPIKISNLLQEQFITVFSNPRYSEEEILNMVEDGGSELESIEINVQDIEKAILQIGSNASAGPDDISPILLKKCVNSLSLPLCMLWNHSFQNGVIPQKLKEGLVIPVHKGGPRTKAKNYRAISLTSHLIKAIERVLVKKLIEYLESVDLLNNRQHGFRKNRSCLSQLMDHYQSILNIMENGNAADVIYLDFAKAFDKVDHGILIRKLRSLGIGGQILKWIHAFLSNRRQIVSVEGKASDEAKVTSGVPQGTVLGPLLFLIFIGDIDGGIQFSLASSFADDTRLMMNVSNTDDIENMQKDLNNLYEWTSNCNMQFNGEKFLHLRYGWKLDSQTGYQTENGNNISQVDNLKDLGVIMSSSASFEDHINQVCSKGKDMAGWILRTFSARDSTTMLTLFKTMVLPLVEYCCQLWSPNKQYLIKSIESVQRHFTSKISGMTGLSYRQRLRKLKLYSLERRRDRYSVIYVWKILQGLAPNMLGEDQLRNVNNPRLGRLCALPPLKSRSPRSIQTLKESSFCVRGPKLFNELPPNLRNFDGKIDTFKTKLDRFLSTVKDEPYDPDEPLVAASNSLKDQIMSMKAAAHSNPVNMRCNQGGSF